MIVDNIININNSDLFLQLKWHNGQTPIFLKLEGFNIAGSIKLKVAIKLIDGLESRGLLVPGKNKVVESSSGNLGVALSLICKRKGYPFLCIVDPNTTQRNNQLIELYGGQVLCVKEKDENNGFLGTRIKYIKQLLANDKSYIWTNQYENLDNPKMHYQTTAKEIFDEFPDGIDYLFVGAGTTGTLMGCAQYCKQHRKKTKVIAVDPLGSVTFGGPSGKRYLPGLGMSQIPAILQTEFVDQVITVSERDTIAMCDFILDEHNLLVGASTGSVLAGIDKIYQELDDKAVIVAISPDFGTNYLGTLFNKGWRAERGL